MPGARPRRSGAASRRVRSDSSPRSLLERGPASAGAVIASTAFFAAIRRPAERVRGSTLAADLSLRHPCTRCGCGRTERSSARPDARGIDLSRRSYDLLDPAGRALFLVDAAGRSGASPRSLAGGRQLRGGASRPPRGSSGTAGPPRSTNAADGLRTTVDITLPGAGRCRGALDDHRGEPGEHGAIAQGGALPGMGPQSPRRRPGPYPVQPALRRDGVRRRPSRRPGLGQACQGHGRPGRRTVRRRASSRRGSISSAGPGASGRPGAGDAGVLGDRETPRRTRRWTRSAACSSA